MFALCLKKDGKPVVEKNVVGTEVFFRNACEEELKAYVATGEPMGKAGAYAIQGRGGNFVERINGDWSNVVGLPFARLLKCLKKQESGFGENMLFSFSLFS